MIVTTPPCPRCREASRVEVDLASYRLWLRGIPAQTVFPNKTPEERELLMTGTHPACWKEIFWQEDVEDPDGACEVCGKPSNGQWCPRCAEDA